MSDTKTVQVAPAAALTEAMALTEFYRNRCLLLANAVHELQGALQAQAAEMERMEAAMPEEPAEEPQPPAKPIQVVTRRKPKGDDAAPAGE